MAGESDQPQDKIIPEAETEPQFRYSDLVFDEASNQQSYQQYQRLAVTLKQNHTQWINNGINELNKQNKQPHNRSLAHMVLASRD